MINESIFVECFRSCLSFAGHRISPLAAKYKPPHLLLFLESTLVARHPHPPRRPSAPARALARAALSTAPVRPARGLCTRLIGKTRSSRHAPRRALKGTRPHVHTERGPGWPAGCRAPALLRPRRRPRGTSSIILCYLIHGPTTCLEHSILFKVITLHPPRPHQRGRRSCRYIEAAAACAHPRAPACSCPRAPASRPPRALSPHRKLRAF